MGTHPIFESDFDCLTECRSIWGAEVNTSNRGRRHPVLHMEHFHSRPITVPLCRLWTLLVVTVRDRRMACTMLSGSWGDTPLRCLWVWSQAPLLGLFPTILQ